MKKLRFALIGCGRISPNHVQAALMNNCNIVALCDLDTSKCEALVEKYNIDEDTKIYNDYMAMLENENIDFVAIATESGNHAEIAVNCIKSGKHVIIEKPFAMSLKDAQMIIDYAKEYNVKVCANHQNRFNEAVKRTREAIEANLLGKLSHGSIHVRWNRNQNYYDQASWRGTWKNDGGALMNQCIHGIDLLRWMMGDEIEEVYGVTKQQFHDYLECEDIGMAVIKFKNGSIGTIEGTTNVYPKNLEETLYLFGKSGTIKLGGKSTNAIDVWDIDGEEKENQGFIEEVENVYGNGHRLLYADMIDSIINNREPLVNGEAGKRALELVLAIYKSSYTGEAVKFPLDDCSTLDFIGQFDK